jgi:hypothetical protein
MKKLYLIFVSFLISHASFADNESVCVVTSGSDICSASELGPINPCATVVFRAKGDIPTDYVAVAKYEWFVNGVLIQTSTDPTKTLFPWAIVSNATDV